MFLDEGSHESLPASHNFRRKILSDNYLKQNPGNQAELPRNVRRVSPHYLRYNRFYPYNRHRLKILPDRYRCYGWQLILVSSRVAGL